MKRLILTALVLVLLAGVAPTAQGQQPHRFRFDSGLATPGPDQILRITIASTPHGQDTDVFEWVRSVYADGECAGGVCRNALVSRTASGRMHLSPREGISIDIPHSAGGVRAEVLSARPEAMRVTFQVVDTVTGAVTAFFEAWPAK